MRRIGNTLMSIPETRNQRSICQDFEAGNAEQPLHLRLEQLSANGQLLVQPRPPILQNVSMPSTQPTDRDNAPSAPRSTNANFSYLPHKLPRA